MLTILIIYIKIISNLNQEKNCNALDIGTDIGVRQPATGFDIVSNFYIFGNQR